MRRFSKFASVAIVMAAVLLGATSAAQAKFIDPQADVPMPVEAVIVQVAEKEPVEVEPRCTRLYYEGSAASPDLLRLWCDDGDLQITIPPWSPRINEDGISIGRAFMTTVSARVFYTYSYVGDDGRLRIDDCLIDRKIVEGVGPEDTDGWCKVR